MKKIIALILTVVGMMFLCGAVYADLNEGLVAYYPFNGNANDESGNGNNGAVNGATLTLDRFGNEDSAYSFDGLNDYIQLGISNKLKMPAFTLATWAKTSYNGGNCLYRWWNYGQAWFVNTSSFSLGFHSSTGAYYSTSYKFPIDEDWHFLVGSFDGSTLKLYKDGVLLTTNSNTAPIYYNAATGAFIGKNGSENYFNGKIDDFRIYNRALSEVEIQELFTIDDIVEIPSNQLEAPVLTSTTNGLEFNLSWTEVEGAEGYSGRLSFDGESELEPFDLGNKTNIAGRFPYPIEMYFEVFAYNSTQSSDYSNLVKIVLDDKYLSMPEIRTIEIDGGEEVVGIVAFDGLSTVDNVNVISIPDNYIIKKIELLMDEDEELAQAYSEIHEDIATHYIDFATSITIGLLKKWGSYLSVMYSEVKYALVDTPIAMNEAMDEYLRLVNNNKKDIIIFNPKQSNYLLWIQKESGAVVKTPIQCTTTQIIPEDWL